MNGGAVTLLYDGDRNRAAKTASGVTTRYLVDDLNPAGYAQVIEEVVNGAVQRGYTYGLQRISESQPINNTWTPSFYGYDGMGNVRQLTSATGAITDTYNYGVRRVIRLRRPYVSSLLGFSTLFSHPCRASCKFGRAKFYRAQAHIACFD